MKEELQQKVEETLAALDGMGRAEAPPFLYNKVRNRLQRANDFVPQWLAWRMVAALLIMALLNAMTIRHFSAEEKSASGAEAVAGDYAIALPQTY